MSKGNQSLENSSCRRIGAVVVLLAVAISVAPAADTTYTQNGGSASLLHKSYTASSTNTSGVLVTNGGVLTLDSSTVSTTGNTTSEDSSNFYGQNAGILVNSASTVTITNCTITTTGSGANGVFSTGTSTKVTMVNDSVFCSGSSGHGVDATQTGTLTLTNCFIKTTNAHGAALATDRGNGTITATGGTYLTTGQDSPGIYSTGDITVSDATISATSSEAVVIEGSNNAILKNVDLTGGKGSRNRGILIYQSTSGDASGDEGVFTMTNGSYTWQKSGPAFYVTNATAYITLTDVVVSSSSDTLMEGSVNQWGTTNKNGGHLVNKIYGTALTGNIYLDKISSMRMYLRDTSSLSGAINTANTASGDTLVMDGTSSWTLTANSYLSVLQDTAGISGDSITNITGNGYNVYYNSALAGNALLGGGTYNLINGGALMPTTATAVDEEATTTVPTSWSLDQNYPNPFNPTTTIGYALPKAADVTLKVYNIVGQEIATLVQGQMTAGSHAVTFNASMFASGVYFYRITAGQYTAVRRMVLLK